VLYFENLIGRSRLESDLSEVACVVSTDSSNASPSSADTLISRLASSLTASSIYPDGHPSRVQELNRFLEFLQPQLQRLGQVNLKVTGRNLAVGDVTLDSSNSAASSVITSMTRRGIEEIVIRAGATPQELSTLFSCLRADPEAVRAAGGLEKAFPDLLPLPNITLVEMHYELPEDARPAESAAAEELTVKEALQQLCLLQGAGLRPEQWQQLEEMFAAAEDLPEEVVDLVLQDILGDQGTEPRRRRELLNQALEQLRTFLQQRGLGQSWEAVKAALAEQMARLDHQSQLMMLSASEQEGSPLKDIIGQMEDDAVAEVLAQAAQAGEPGDVVEVIQSLTAAAPGLTDLSNPIHEKIADRVGEQTWTDIIQPAVLEMLAAQGAPAEELDPDILAASGLVEPPMAELVGDVEAAPGRADEIERQSAVEHAEIITDLISAGGMLEEEQVETARHLSAALAELLGLGMEAVARRLLTRVLWGNQPEAAPALTDRARAVLLDGLGADERVVSALKEMLTGGSPAQRRHAAEFFLLLGPRVVHPLFDILVTDARTSARRNALTVLARIGPEAVNPLAQHLADGDPHRIAMAVRVLGQIGTREAGARLLSATAHTSPVVRRAVVRAAGQLGPELSSRVGALLLSDSEPDIRIAAVHLLASARQPDAAALLADLALGSVRTDRDTQQEAVVALGNFPDEKTVQVLSRIARGHRRRIPEELRLAAVNSLQRLGTPDALAALTELARSTKGRVARACADAAAELASPNQASQARKQEMDVP